MNKISQITSPDTFVTLVKSLLAAEYHDFQTIDDSGGDGGNDGFSESEETLFQIYCPEKPEKITDAKYIAKIKKDLEKAKKLIDSGKYIINEWVFVTPSELREPVQTYLRNQAKLLGIKGIAWSEIKLTTLLCNHSNLRSQFPELIQPDIEALILRGEKKQEAVDEVKKEYKSKIENRYQARINQVKQELNQEKFERAKKEYDRILTDLLTETEIIDPHIFFRVFHNLGVAEYNLQNIDKAIEFFQKANDIEPDLPIAVCKGALVKLLKGFPEEGLLMIEELLKKHPNDDEAITMKANILYDLGEFSTLLAFLKEKREMALTHWFSGHELMNQKDYNGAISSFEKVILFEPKNVQALNLIAHNIMIYTNEMMQENPLPPDRIPKTVSKMLMRAVECLKEAEQLLADKENNFYLGMVYANLSGCYLAQGLNKESIETAEKSTRINPKSPVPLLNKGVAQLSLCLYHDALKSFQMFKDLGGNDREVDKRIVFCLIQTNDFMTAEKYINDLLVNGLGLDLDIAELAIDLYSRRLENDKLNSVLCRLEKEFPNNSKAMRIRAIYMQRLGSDGVDVLLQRALQNSTTEVEKMLTEICLADFYFDHSNYEPAAEYYKKYINIQEGNYATWRYAQTIYNLGQYSLLLNWIETISPEFRMKTPIQELEANANLNLNNLDKASKLFKQLFEKNSDCFQYIVSYGMCQFRLGKENEAKIAFDTVKNRLTDTQNLILLAGGYEFIGEREIAIDLAFKALENDSNNPKAHLAFISIFLRREQAGGKELAEKYIKAFQKSFGEFNNRFPEEKGFQKLKIKENDIGDILKPIDQIAERTEKIIDLYKKSQAFFASIPQFIGKRPYDVWASFIQTPSIGIKASFNTIEEIKSEAKILEEAFLNAIVIDIYPLFLLSYSNQLDLLPLFFKRIYIHQTILDEITETVNDLKIFVRDGISILAKINGEYCIREITLSEIQESLTLMEELRDFITTNMCIEIRGNSEEKLDIEQNIFDVLDKSTRDSALLAKELMIPYFCDDRLLRSIMIKEHLIKSFSTQNLIIVAFKKGIISLERKFELFKVMIDLHYEYLSIDANFIFDQLKNEKYRIENIASVVSLLVRKETSIQSLEIVLADLIFILFMDKFLDDKGRQQILHYILKEASPNHNLVNVEEGLLFNLQNRLLPGEREQLKHMIRSVLLDLQK